MVGFGGLKYRVDFYHIRGTSNSGGAPSRGGFIGGEGFSSSKCRFKNAAVSLEKSRAIVDSAVK